MEIGLYIEEILKDRGKVSIPGVGTFYSNKIPAHYDEQLDVFLPPSRKLNFKLIEEGNTSEFSEYISNAESIAVVAADRIINKFAAKFITELGTTGVAEIEGLGKLKREGVEYIIETHPYYGLEPVEELDIILPPAPEPFVSIDAEPEESIATEPVIVHNTIDIPVKEEPAILEDTNPGPVARKEDSEEILSQTVSEGAEEILSEEPEEIISEKITANAEQTTEADQGEDYLSFRLRQREEARRMQDAAPELSSHEQEKPISEKEYLNDEIADEIRYNRLTDPESVDSLFDGIINNNYKNNESRDEEQTRSVSLKTWLIIAFFALALIIAGGVFMFYPQIRDFKQRFLTTAATTQSAPKPVPAVIPVTPPDSVLNDSLKLSTESTAADSAAFSNERTYEIRIAAFELKSEAEELIRKLKNKTKDVYLVEMPAGKYKYLVSAGKFDTYEAAQAGMSQVRKDFNQISEVSNVLIVPIPQKTTKP